jgi:hypothetical protein
MRLRILPEARQELLEAQAWYESKAQGLGLKFAQAAQTAVAGALHAPYGYPRIEAEFRRVLLRKFPYFLICLVQNDELTLIALYHQRKRPNGWLTRLNN